MKCIQCDTEFEAKRADAQFCSDKCRMAYKRKIKLTEGTTPAPMEPVGASNDQPLEDKKISEQTIDPTIETVAITPTEDLTILPREEIESRIRAYPRDTWVDSPEFLELIRRFETMSIEDLQAGGYHIPNWKMNGMNKYPRMGIESI